MRAPISNKDRAASQWNPNQFRYSLTATQQSQPEQTSKAVDYGEQIVKFIPAEVIAFYIPAIAAASGFNAKAQENQILPEYTYALWIIFIVGLIGTLAYMYKSSHDGLIKEKILNPVMRASAKAVISAIAFIIWAFYLGGAFAGINYQPIIGPLLIVGFTFANPLLYSAIPFPDKTYDLKFDQIVVKKTQKGIPGYVKTFEIKNRCSENVKIGLVRLYGLNVLGQRIRPYEIDANQIAEADASLPFTKQMDFVDSKVKKHILVAETSRGKIESQPVEEAAILAEPETEEAIAVSKPKIKSENEGKEKPKKPRNLLLNS